MPTARRTTEWLKDRLELLWTRYFSDAPVGYPIRVEFGRPARTRYGSIFNVGCQCRIRVNGLFADPEVPEFVVDATLLHELVHYVHGYGSGLPKLHSSPHRGRVIESEMERRGCLHVEEAAAVWRNNHWEQFFEDRMAGMVHARVVRGDTHNRVWMSFLERPGYRSCRDLAERVGVLAPRFGVEPSPFAVSWLLASPHRRGLSYRFPSEGSVKLHALLAHPDVPPYVVDYELCYWLAEESAGRNWDRIEEALRSAGMWCQAQKAIAWRRTVWPQFRKSHIPI
ncbi:MAG: hypothetical protein ACP5VE_08360 [Chthonomonadales bacterium]